MRRCRKPSTPTGVPSTASSGATIAIASGREVGGASFPEYLIAEIAPRGAPGFLFGSAPLKIKNSAAPGGAAARGGGLETAGAMALISALRQGLVASMGAIAYHPGVMGCPSTGSVRSLASATLVALFAVINNADAGEPNICAVVANPSGFDHRQLTLEGIVAGLSKSTSRSGHKQMTFLLRSPVGCGGVIVYAQEPATLSNGEHLQVEGIFEIERRRDGSTFHNEMQATKITTLPR